MDERNKYNRRIDNVAEAAEKLGGETLGRAIVALKKMSVWALFVAVAALVCVVSFTTGVAKKIKKGEE